jgi:hypothetical protein
MATWKKVATMSGGRVSGDITGIAHGGLTGKVGINEGGTNTDMSGFAENSLLSFTGTEVAAIAPGANNQVLTTKDGQWTWQDVTDMHDHGDTYLSLATGGEITGSLAVTGTVFADAAVVSELQSITEASGDSLILNSGAGSGTTHNAGMYVNVDGAATLADDDPAILWDNNNGRWQMGKYNNNMQNIAFADVTSTPVAGASTDYAGTIACKDGNIFISV